MPSLSAEDRVLQVMRSHESPMSPGEMLDRLGADYADSTIRNAMNQLATKGLLDRSGHGVYELPSTSKNQSNGKASADPQSGSNSARDPIYSLVASAGDGSYEVGQDTVGYVTGANAMSRPGKDVMWVFVRGDSMGETYQKMTMVPVQRFTPTLTELAEDDVYLFRLEGAVQIKRLQRLPGQRIRVKSDNPKYDDFHIQLDDGVDFEILGRVLV
mgnify:CR=1 FL=1